MVKLQGMGNAENRDPFASPIDTKNGSIVFTVERDSLGKPRAVEGYITLLGDERTIPFTSAQSNELLNALHLAEIGVATLSHANTLQAKLPQLGPAASKYAQDLAVLTMEAGKNDGMADFGRRTLQDALLRLHGLMHSIDNQLAGKTVTEFASPQPGPGYEHAVVSATDRFRAPQFDDQNKGPGGRGFSKT